MNIFEKMFLQFLICDCFDLNIKKLNYYFYIKFIFVKGICVDLISLQYIYKDILI